MSEASPQIVSPPKLYLDTGHLINIVRLRQGRELSEGQDPGAYSFLDECIKEYLGIIFNPAAPLEWVDGEATKESANDIAAVIDSAKLSYLHEYDTCIYLAELLEECQRKNPTIAILNLPKIHKWGDGERFKLANEIIAAEIPDYFSENELDPVGNSSVKYTWTPAPSARDYVERAFQFRQIKPGTHRQRVDDWNTGMQEDMDCMNEYSSSPVTYQMDCMKRWTRIDTVIETLNPGINVDAILSEIEIAKCPAANLYIRARDHRIRASFAPKDNDVDDWMSLPVVPYADFVLTERQLRHFIRQVNPDLASKVFDNAAVAVQAIKQALT